MIGNNKEQWEELGAQAAVEQDPPQLLRLVTEINELLTAKSRRLGGKEDAPDRKLFAAGGAYDEKNSTQ
jgi:hypothetical protein